MRIGELAELAGVTVKAIRYYERIGLLTPARHRNGYRNYTEADLRVVRELRELQRMGVPSSQAAPFIAYLTADGAECGPAGAQSLAAYREAIASLDAEIAALSERRAALAERLEAAGLAPLGAADSAGVQ